METAHLHVIQPHLVELRDKLKEMMKISHDTAHLNGLMCEVESALSKIDKGTYGVCEQCCEPIEDEYLQTDPLARICFSHYTDAQRAAIERDLELAYKIQNNLLGSPKSHLHDWDIFYHYEPAGPLGGDFYDIISRAQNRDEMFFIFGDVSGKGISAALLMSNLNAIFRSLSEANLPLKDLIEAANRLFYNSTLSTQFATLVFGRATGSGAIELTNAGHVRPLIICGSNVTPIESTGLPVGINYTTGYEVSSYTLDKGGMIFLYTDGLTEVMDASGEQYGEERLMEFLSANHKLEPKELASKLLENAASFRNGGPVTDDLTIMILRRK